MRRLLQPKNIMVSAHARAKEFDKSKYISILNIIQARNVGFGLGFRVRVTRRGKVKKRGIAMHEILCRQDRQ